MLNKDDDNNAPSPRKFVLEEFIWGHRLHDDQDINMVLLEFLCAIQNLPFSEYSPNKFVYQIPRRKVLRALIFNNPQIEAIGEKTDDPWGEWEKLFKENGENRDLFAADSGWNCEYLKKAFAADEGEKKSFENFAQTVRFLRSSAINIRSDKRWTSLFVFPWGEDCLYVDMSLKGGQDRRFFARGGILVYLMLAHASNRSKLEALLREKLLNSDSPYDRICKALQSYGESCKVPDDFATESGSSLPDDKQLTPRDLANFNSLCDDLIQVLSLNMPAPDMLHYFRDAIGLHLIRWILDRGSWALEKPEDSRYILCEMLQKKSTEIRRISKENYIENDKQSEAALRNYLKTRENEIKNDVFSFNAETYDEDRFKDLAKDEFRINGKYFDEELKDLSENKFKDQFRKDVLAKHKKHVGKVHGIFAKNIELATTLYSNAYRYAPSDSFLKSLVMILVDKERMPLTDFLAKAYQKFGIVIGPVEAREAGIQQQRGTEDKQFEDNQTLLVNRLKSIGLLISLSDGFPYVINSYFAAAKE